MFTVSVTQVNLGPENMQLFQNGKYRKQYQEVVMFLTQAVC